MVQRRRAGWLLLASVLGSVLACGGATRKPGSSTRGKVGSAESGGFGGSLGASGSDPGGTSGTSAVGSEGDAGSESGSDKRDANASEEARTMAFCDAFNEALLRYYVRCYGATTEDWQTELRLKPCEPLARAAELGRIRYDAGQATECLASLEREPCGFPMVADSSPCALTLAGQVPLGSRCRWLIAGDGWSDCVPGAYCGAEGEEDAMAGRSVCGGTCVARAGLGAPCGVRSTPPFCATGLACRGGLCLAEAVEGEPCLGLEGPECRFDLYCEGEGDILSGTCRVRRKSGPCSPNSGECADGYLCFDAEDGSGECTRAKLPGEPCEPGRTECWGFCGAEGHCEVRAAQGSQCGVIDKEAGFSFVRCMPDLFCSVVAGMSGTCEPQLALGDTCGTDMYRYPPGCPTMGDRLGYCDRTTSQCALCD
ncbi:hypothetical protein ACFL5O_02700 [Myxococcota bacterium]